MKKLLTAIFALGVLLMLAACGKESGSNPTAGPATPTSVVKPTEGAKATEAVKATEALKPTESVEPTEAVQPTEGAAPTEEAKATSAPEPTKKPKSEIQYNSDGKALAGTEFKSGDEYGKYRKVNKGSKGFDIDYVYLKSKGQKEDQLIGYNVEDGGLGVIESGDAMLVMGWKANVGNVSDTGKLKVFICPTYVNLENGYASSGWKMEFPVKEGVSGYNNYRALIEGSLEMSIDKKSWTYGFFYVVFSYDDEILGYIPVEFIDERGEEETATTVTETKKEGYSFDTELTRLGLTKDSFKNLADVTTVECDPECAWPGYNEFVMTLKSGSDLGAAVEKFVDLVLKNSDDQKLSNGNSETCYEGKTNFKDSDYIKITASDVNAAAKSGSYTKTAGVIIKGERVPFDIITSKSSDKTITIRICY